MIKELKPLSLQGENIDALLDSFDLAFAPLFSQVINALIYSRIDEIADTNLLDLLAWQFHIEGWERIETVEEKRKAIKSAIQLHRYKGTPWAVKHALKSIGHDSELKEWFQYNGNKYRFKVFSLKPIKSEDEFVGFIQTINEHKNERSWLDSIGTHHEHSLTLYACVKTCVGNKHIVMPNMPDFYIYPATNYADIGFRVANYISIGVANG